MSIVDFAIGWRLREVRCFFVLSSCSLPFGTLVYVFCINAPFCWAMLRKKSIGREKCPTVL